MLFRSVRLSFRREESSPIDSLWEFEYTSTSNPKPVYSLPLFIRVSFQ